MLLCAVPALGGSDAIRSTTSTRVHHAARQRGGVAARGARAASERCRYRLAQYWLSRVAHRQARGVPRGLTNWATSRAGTSRSSTAGPRSMIGCRLATDLVQRQVRDRHAGGRLRAWLPRMRHRSFRSVRRALATSSSWAGRQPQLGQAANHRGNCLAARDRAKRLEMMPEIPQARRAACSWIRESANCGNLNGRPRRNWHRAWARLKAQARTSRLRPGIRHA